MRMSDWSSDVCSSDLNDRRAFHSSWREKLREVIARGAIGAVFVNTARDEASWPWAQRAGDWARPAMRLRGDDGEGIDTFPQLRVVAVVSAARSEVNTSELQSLMRISYAGFCLKTKTI